MPELEFLPNWYPQLRRRKRWLVLQAWGSLLLIAGLGAWTMIASRSVHAQEGRLATLVIALSRTEAQLHQLDELLTLEKQQRQQVLVLDKLGAHVEGARLLARLEETMPNEMALLSLSFQISEQPRPLAALAAGAPRSGPALERRLGVTLKGVAPTDVDVANFLARLSAIPFFEQVAMTYAKDRSDNGHLMREFELTFNIALGPAE